MTSSAASRVLNLVEILEDILSNLVVRDVLSAERVCRQWRSVIVESSLLQHSNLFMVDRAGASSNINLPKNLFRLYQGRRSSVPSSARKQHNPLFTQRFVQQAAYHAIRQVNPSAKFYDMDPAVIMNKRYFDDEAASWRRMCLFEPPQERALIEPMIARYDFQQYLIQNQEGLMMSDIVDLFNWLARGEAGQLDLIVSTARRKLKWFLVPHP